MKPYHQYMMFYTSLQLIGVYGILKITEWEKKSREKINK